MKKTLLIVLTVICSSLVTSCKKDYTCTCKYTATGDPFGSYEIHDRKANAKTQCDGQTSGRYTYSTGVSCVLEQLKS